MIKMGLRWDKQPTESFQLLVAVETTAMRQSRKSVCQFCRATFDTDNIDIGPERRNYLDHRLSRVWESNGQVRTPSALFPQLSFSFSCSSILSIDMEPNWYRSLQSIIIVIPVPACEQLDNYRHSSWLIDQMHYMKAAYKIIQYCYPICRRDMITGLQGPNY